MEYYDVMCLGLVALERGDHIRAAMLGAECLELAKRIGHARGSANALYVLGRAAVGRGDHLEGRESLEKSLALYRQYADWDGMQWCLRGLGHLAIDQGDAAAARSFFRESLGLADAAGDRLELASSLEGLSGVAADARPERAVRLAGAAAALRAAIGSQHYPWERERVDRSLEAAARNLSQDAYRTAWAEGWAMPLEQALALASAEDRADETPQAAGVPERSTHDLSPREREVIRLVAGGRTNRQIAEHLVIALRTADTHVGNILTKLDLHSRAELAVWAVEHGVTTSRPD